jgi:hypothetical protein
MMGMKLSAGPCKIHFLRMSVGPHRIHCLCLSVTQVEHIVCVCRSVNVGYEAIILADAIRQADRNECLIQSDGLMTQCYRWANGNDS